jgi:hypothetical protein
MTKDLALTLLAQGGNGNEILRILDGLMDSSPVDSVDSSDSEEEIEF